MKILRMLKNNKSKQHKNKPNFTHWTKDIKDLYLAASSVLVAIKQKDNQKNIEFCEQIPAIAFETSLLASIPKT